MKNLVIIGARGYGREIYGLAQSCIGFGINFEVKGFLDDKIDALDGFKGYPPILDSVENYKIASDDVFVCALGDVAYKQKYIQIILNKGGTFISLIHSSAFIGQNTTIGKGVILAFDVHISCDVSIADFVTVMTGSVIGHDSSVGAWSSIGVRSFLGGSAILGQRTTIHTGAIVLPHKRIGKNAIVGAGSVVLRDVKEGITVFGSPAKEL